MAHCEIGDTVNYWCIPAKGGFVAQQEAFSWLKAMTGENRLAAPHSIERSERQRPRLRSKLRRKPR
jgi:hypothetical protein